MNFAKLHRRSLTDGHHFPILLNLDDVSGVYPDLNGGSVIALRHKQDAASYTGPGFFSVAETAEEMQRIIAALQGAIPEKDNVTPLTISQFIDHLYPKPEAQTDG